MLPCRGLRPTQLAYRAPRQATNIQTHASRKFSSLPRTAGLSAPCRTSPLQSAQWRAGVARHQNVILTASSVRYGSWYAPWSWGRSSTPTASTTTEVPIADISSKFEHTTPTAPVTTATPEMAPAGIDKPAFINETSDTSGSLAEAASAISDRSHKTMDEIWVDIPTKDTLPVTELDPTRLIDHAGHLKELGLDYGWGMTTMFEKVIETIYLQTGMGWAGSIVAAAIVVRFSTFYFQAKSSDNVAAMSSLKPLSAPIQEKMEAALARGDKAQADLYKMQQQEMMRPYTGTMVSMAGFMVMQGWIGFCAFRCLRAMSYLPVPGMSEDGLLWFTDLTARDPYFILPVATSALMYTIFKNGGETGISTDASRTQLLKFMALFLGAVTAFQASGLQIYFLMTAILGGITGWALRQNGFRRMIGIRIIPTKESHEVYTKVVRGELKLQDIKGHDGKVRYQPPTITAKPANKRNATTLSGINIKAGTTLPAHLKVEAPKINTERPDRDIDYEEGAAGKPLMEKLDYYRRNYRLAYMVRRFQGSMENIAKKAGYGGESKLTAEQQKRKKRAEDYEIERRRRFENRK
ncbi:mitochondrial export translocase Oxa1 [Pyrenochaeta sp. DS3sAY3a]|nr:mitochondrial export translocase Oxa1 [Pyrenochaeta sp. DS3sAY3a]